MKKALSFLFLIVLCASLVACSGQGAAQPTTEPATDPTEATAFDWDAVMNASRGSSCAMEEHHEE